MASRGVNRVILVGHLGNDPEVRYMPNGNAVANISLATSESWKDQQGQQQERTEWHRVVLYRGLAETAAKFLSKGSKIFVEGELQTRKWQDNSGQDRYTTEIVGLDMKLMNGSNTHSQSASMKPSKYLQQPHQQSGERHQQTPALSGPEFDDDYPF